MRFSRSIFLFMPAVVLICGCQAVRVYEGSRLPGDEVSRIKAEPASILQTMTLVAPELLSVDFTPAGNKVYEVLPGLHRVIVFLGKPGNMGSHIEMIYFETEPGVDYKVYGVYGQEIWVEDDAGEAVRLYMIAY